MVKLAQNCNNRGFPLLLFVHDLFTQFPKLEVIAVIARIIKLLHLTPRFQVVGHENDFRAFRTRKMFLCVLNYYASHDFFPIQRMPTTQPPTMMQHPIGPKNSSMVHSQNFPKALVHDLQKFVIVH